MNKASPSERHGPKDWTLLASELRHGLKALMLHKLRSLLTMMGVVFGVASVIAMLAVGEGANLEALRRIRQLGSQNIILSSVRPFQESTGDQQAIGSASFYGLTYDDLTRIRSSIPYVGKTLRVKADRQEASLGLLQHEYRIVGVEPAWFDMFAQQIVLGRSLDDEDMATGADVCVVTGTAAQTLLAGRRRLGEKVRIARKYYEVVGIVTSSGSASAGGIETPNQADDIYIPLSTFTRRFGDFRTRFMSGGQFRSNVELDQIIVEVTDDSKVEAVAESIDYLLARFHKLEDYAISVPLTLLRQAEATKRTFNIVLGSIAGISLLVGGIGIMNIMLASVTERTREIGIRRAIGAKRRQIIRQFLIETTSLSMIGGGIGIALGMSMAAMIEYYAQMPTYVRTWSVLLSMGISVAVGISFGLYPAVRAARLDPITALRHE
jgi:putative ABC transport system permease protein